MQKTTIIVERSEYSFFFLSFIEDVFYCSSQLMFWTYDCKFWENKNNNLETENKYDIDFGGKNLFPKMKPNIALTVSKGGFNAEKRKEKWTCYC